MNKLHPTNTEQQYVEAKDWYVREFSAATETESMPLPDVYGNENDDNNPQSIPRTADFALSVRQDDVKEIADRLGVDICTPFAAAFAFTLGNFTNDRQALFAITHNGKTLPAYIDFSKVKTVEELIHLTNTQMLTAYEKSQYPFEECCKDIGLNIQTCFEFGKHTTNDNRVYPEPVLESVEGVGGRQTFQLIPNVFQNNDGTFKCQIKYQGNKHSDEIIAQLCQTYDNVLCQMFAKTNLADMELLDKSQLEQVCSFNQTDENLTFNNYRNIISLFRDVAGKYPDNIAVEYKDYKISYSDFDKLTDRIATSIAEHIENNTEQSVGTGNDGVGLPVVSILLGRSENIAIMPIAALKAGAAYQPLDPSYPQERLNFMVKDSGAQLVITDRDLRSLLNEYEGDVLFTDDIANNVEQTAIDKNALRQAEERLNETKAFSLLYTSGSTGVPKGVILEHGNLLTYCSYNYKHINLSPGSKIAAYASFGFDANMSDLCSALTCGANLVIIPDEVRLDLDAIYDYFADHGVTHALLTTQVAYQFATIYPEHPTLKVLTAGGEKLATLQPPTYQLYNLYGPTETTVYATSKIVERKETNIPIGLSNSTAPCLIVSKYGKRLPVGAAGELVITGKQVARGYLNRPDKTKEVFGTVNKHTRAYRTGDIVRYRGNGDIEFIGRRDSQVKIRGFRIELKEVESVIREFNGIKDATVQAFDLDGGGKYIAAYIVSDIRIDIQAMNDFIASQKPPYMVPAVTMQIDAIPLNVNQKVDKKKLPKPEVKNPEGNEGNAPARELNVLEKQLVEMVGQLIGNTPDIATPLTYCGLSSILSMRLAAKINKLYGFKFSTKDLMGGATILTVENAILEQLVRNSGTREFRNPGSSGTQGLRKSENPETTPLTFSQQGVYLDCQARPDTLIYNLPLEVKFPKSVDAGKLAEATKTVLESHPILFAHFSEDGQGNTIQTLDAEKTAEVTVVSVESADDYEEQKKAFLHPFNLKTDRLFRAKVVNLQSNNEKILLIDIHHLVCDGGSVEIMINQIISALKGSAVERETYTYLDFCADQKHFAASQEFIEHKEFFSQQLKDFDSVTDIVPNVSTSEPGKPQEVAIAIPSTLRLSTLNTQLAQDSSNRGIHVTEAEFWLAATAYALGRFANSRDVYFSTVSSGRQNLDIADTVGMFVNTLPISAHIKDQTVGEFIQETAKTFKDTTDHENYPFSHIAGDYGYTAGITYAYQLGLIGDNRIDGKEIVWNQFGLDKPMFRIAIFIEMYDGKPSLVLQYDDSLYSESLIRSLAESIVSAACNMVANVNLPVSKLSLMTPAAIDKICNIGKGEELDYDQNLTIPDILRRQAQLTPDAIAVVFHDKELSYRQLDDITDSMACQLQSLGVGRETVTGIMIERSELMAIFPMAVMKAGGAYMPLDPEFPEDRLLFMCDDANVNLILTSDGLAQKIMPNYKGRIENDIHNAQCKPAADNPQLKTITSKPQPGNLMVVLYTSGSTGKPKGVLLEQRSIVNFCHWYVKNYNMTSDDRTAAYANFGFDAHMIDLYPTYLAGASVHILDTDIRHDLVAMSEYINKHKLTISFMTTQIGCQMATLFDLPSMRCLSTGGEKMPQITPPAYDFYNVYGPTECSLFSTFYKVTEPSFDGKIIGKPLANYQLYVVDADRNILPVGAAGELLVEGRGVARGYLNRPDVNAEKFVIISDNRKTAQKSYRTGDQVRWTADGNIEYIGRLDGQVKLRGLRIELGEVDTMMSRFPAIRQAAATVRDVAGSQHLCGYFTVKEGMTVSEDELKEFMRQNLTDFMIPDFFVPLDTMPLTSNGKVDKKKLPVPESNGVQNYVEPRNDVERFFCETVAKTLNLERVGITDNFFQIGGTSLIAMRLAVAVSKGGYNMVYKDLFDHPTPEDMARFVTNENSSTGSGQDHNGNRTNSKPQNPTTLQPTSYNYDRVNHIVSRNNIGTYLSDTSHHALGTVFLTGATGYLGIHVLHELLENPDIPAIYCLVRSGKNNTALSRLQTLLYYYFDKAYEEQVGKRMFVIEGDVTKPFDYVNVPVNTVINCAANVKHFSAGTDIEDINVGGTLNCIDLCLRTGARFIHTSTGSIGGFTVSDDKNTTPHILLENEFWFGQDLDNKYALSKFIAEREVLEAIAEKGLKAKIMRMGNLGPRSTDGEFQINFRSNAFMGQLKGFQTLQAIPYSAMTNLTEFSPIDDAARAICLLSTTNDNCTIYHVLNSHRPLYVDIVNCINKVGCVINPTDDQTFESILQKALLDDKKADILQSLLAYSTRSDGKTCVENSYASDYTTQVLLHFGFQWDMTTWDYIEQFLLKIKSLGFFDDDYVR